MPDISYYGVKEMSGVERKDFLAWYERYKSEPYDYRSMLL